MNLALRACSLAACLALHVVIARAAEFPERPVRIIVNTAAAGTSDVIARVAGQHLAAHWSKNVVIDNRPGGGGVIGAQALARATPDGHTLGIVSSSFVMNGIVRKELPYDVMRDFLPVALIGTVPGLLVVHPALPAKDARSAFELAKAHPAKFNYGSPVPLSAGHRAMELLKRAAGADIRHVPYKSGAQAVTDLIAGQVQFLVISIPSVIGHVRSGRVRALGVTSLQRFDGLPDVPALAESAFPGFESIEWYGLQAPANLPEATLAKLGADARQVIARTELRRQLADVGVVPSATGSTADLRARIQGEHARWSRLAAELKLQAD